MGKVKWDTTKTIDTTKSRKGKGKSGTTKGITTKKSFATIESKLLDHQQRVVNHMLSHRGLLVNHGMGAGKTRIAVALSALLRVPSVVVLPASLRQNFDKEIDNMSADLGRQIPKSLYTVISLQSFLDGEVDCNGKILIVDEAHELRNPQGKVSQKVQECAMNAYKVLLLTGTPLVNSPADIAPLLNMIVKGRMNIQVGRLSTNHDPLGGGLFGINKTTFTDIPTGDSFFRYFGSDGLNRVGKELWSRLLPCVFSHYTPPKTGDFPTAVSHDVMVPMVPQQLRVYNAWVNKTLTKPMIEMLKSKKVLKDVGTFDTLLTKSPAFKAYLDGGRKICDSVEDGTTIYAPKFDEMIAKLKETTGKAIVFTQYIEKGVHVAEKKFIEHGITYVKFTGEETPLQKKIAVEKYNDGKVRVFLLSSAGGVGLDLKETETIHVMDPAWNLSKIKQVVARGVRYKSHKNPNAVVHIYHYFCTLPSNFFGNLFSDDSKRITVSSDIYLREVSMRKDSLNSVFLDYCITASMEKSKSICEQENL